MKPYLDLMPCAGLANRLRAMASGLLLARTLGAVLRIGWKFDRGALEAQFSDLFDTQILPAGVEIVEMGLTPDPAWNSATEYNSADCGAEERIRADFLEGAVCHPCKSWAAFYRPFSADWLVALREFRPRAELLAAAVVIMDGGAGNPRPIGVHIRRTDHKVAIRSTPTSYMWDQMRHEIGAGTSYNFYVASDSQEERLRTLHAFPNQVLLYSAARLERHTVRGCRDAMIEFLCLSRCSKILGSYGSSFGEIAAAYGGIPYEAVGKRD